MKISVDAEYKQLGRTLFFALAGAIAFFFILFKWSVVKEAFGTLNAILMPFIYGLILAYLVSPTYNFFVRTFVRVNWPKTKGVDHSMGIAKTLATMISVLEIVVIIGLFLWMVIPQMIASISTLATDLPATITRAQEWILEKQDLLPDLSQQANTFLQRFSETFIKWVQETLLPGYTSLITGVSEGIIGVVKQLFNFVIGIIVSVYLLNRKTIMLAQCKKLVFATCKHDTAEGIIRGASFTNKTFWNFISGKLMDSAIIGIICFICMYVMDWPYAELISVIIGVTNIIPFFGPFIGAIPSTILMLMESPKLALGFLVFVFLLQQFDGNIVGPKILGESMGLSSFWVMFAILVGGGLFGFLGMVVGVPVFAVLYAYACYIVDKRLAEKGMPILVSDYIEAYQYHGEAPNERFYAEQGLTDQAKANSEDEAHG